ncbi:sulfur carrier protein ThiS [Thermosynechococcus sp. NK55a]|jgi:sulfur carrier protein|uniref:sulfur carrier protein ThiS n=1 Tax=unclassified Thermosynechococcus TaxID=2622553 RepID=UPI0003D93FAB|nr:MULTISPECIES: sulfur carrier protein ThiS [unclassified Thermosynechococcus]AHB89351.1 sulfur carrier protein ThiS [Thermosynechococcus sp. NK55a]RMH63542.1 MAG: thiamine biosynthesis protein ThiS [Cyanobacteria bacterium J003]HIK23378.1 thiamine biosynthesis protein ThiS [Thermosynechococcus sp. M3746_W2019_013]
MVPAEPAILIHVNGTPHTLRRSLSIPELCNLLNIHPRLVAIEYNGEILHRQFWETTYVQAGDRLEIVTIVGGG